MSFSFGTKAPFGTPQAQATNLSFGTQQSSLFGTPGAQQNTGLSFGTPASSAPTLFGTPTAQPSGGLSFGTPGSNLASAPTFGTTTANPALGFGAPVAVAPAFGAAAPAFGTPGVAASGFGSPAAAAPTFGTAAPTFGLPTAAAPTFGVPATASTFGAPAAAAPAFGTPAAAPTFGAPAATPTFGAPSAAPAFGAPVASAAPTFGLASTNAASAFGVATSNPTPSFGAATSLAPTFGGLTSTAPATSLGFGAGTNLSLGGTAPKLGFSSTATTSAGGLSFAPLLPPTSTTGGLSFGTPASSAAGGLNFGAPASTIAGGLTFGTPASSAGLTFGTTTPANTFGLGTSAAPTLGLGFGATATTTASTLNFGTTTTASTGLSFGFSATSAPTSQPPSGLGGIATLTPSQNPTDTKKEAAPRDQQVPNEIQQTIENFKNHVKQEKAYSSDVARCSVKEFRKVEADIDAVNNLLSDVEKQLQLNKSVAEKLKYDSARGLQHVEMAQRTYDTPIGLQYENSAPMAFFMDLVDNFEREMQHMKLQIENTDKYVKNIGKGTPLTSQDLAMGMRRIHETFVALAGRLQAVHSQVDSEKDQYLLFRKVMLNDTTNIFVKETKEAEALNLVLNTVASKPPLIATGPTPFNSISHPSVVQAAAQNNPAPLYGNTSFGSFNQSTGLNIGGAANNTSMFGSTPGFGQTFSLPSTSGFQLQKPPVGTKRGKQ